MPSGLGGLQGLQISHVAEFWRDWPIEEKAFESESNVLMTVEDDEYIADSVDFVQ